MNIRSHPRHKLVTHEWVTVLSPLDALVWLWFRRLSLVAATLAFALVSVLACHTTFGQSPASPADLKTLVKNYAFQNNPKLNPETRFAIEEHSIDGLRALDVQIILARYLAPDGSQFSEALLVYHDGKLTPFASALGGHGLMSAVASGGKLYYTYSWGLGRHRSHLAQLSIVGGTLTFNESEPLLDQDCFVKQDGARLRVEQGEFKEFNAWKAGRKIGEIAAMESGFAVLDDAGKEIETLAAKAPEIPTTLAVSTVGDFSRGYLWHLSVNSAGQAELTIYADLAKPTRQQFQVPKEQWAEFRKAVAAGRFFELKGEYGGQVTSGSERSITVTAGPRTHTVKVRFLRDSTPADKAALREACGAVRLLVLVRGWFDEAEAVDLRKYD